MVKDPGIQAVQAGDKMFGIGFTQYSMQQLSMLVSDPRCDADKVTMLVTANVDHIAHLKRNTDFRKAYRNADFVTIDGFPLMVYAKLRGLNVRKRAPGADLLPLICRNLAQSPGSFKLFFVVANERTARYVKNWFKDKGFGADAVAAVVPPWQFESDPQYSGELCAAIRHHGTTHLFLGIGAPKSEIWVDAHKECLPPLYAFCFGAGLEFFSGNLKRAPRCFRKLGFEWLWRIAIEPRRLFLKYVRNGVIFSAAIVGDLAGRRIMD